MFTLLTFVCQGQMLSDLTSEIKFSTINIFSGYPGVPTLQPAYHYKESHALPYRDIKKEILHAALHLYSTAEIEYDRVLPKVFKDFLLAQLRFEHSDRWSAARLLEHDFFRYFHHKSEPTAVKPGESENRQAHEQLLLKGNNYQETFI